MWIGGIGAHWSVVSRGFAISDILALVAEAVELERMMTIEKN